jgi:hypothetical protein
VSKRNDPSSGADVGLEPSRGNVAMAARDVRLQADHIRFAERFSQILTRNLHGAVIASPYVVRLNLARTTGLSSLLCRPGDLMDPATDKRRLAIILR